MLNRSSLLLSVGFGLIQLLFLSATPTFLVKAQARCSEENLRNVSPPSRESREIRSVRNRFKFQVPANYRAVAQGEEILIFSPQAYEYHQCKPPTSIWYSSAEIWVTDSELPASSSLRQVFDSQSMNRLQIEGSIQQVRIAGETALRYHTHLGGDGLTRQYFLFSPQRTKTITILAWVDSINDPEPEILARIANSFELLFSVTENSPRIGIVPALDVCGLAVWQHSNDNLTHLLTATGGESSANVRIDNQMLQLRATGESIAPEQTHRPSNFTFQNSDRSIAATLQGNWRIEHPGSASGWTTNNATLKVTKGNQTTELPVLASLGCNFLFY